MTTGVYSIKNKATGLYYVGSSKNIEVRTQSHKSMLRNGEHHSYKLQQAYDEGSEDIFEWSIVEECQEKDLLLIEQYWINKLQSFTNGYNILEDTMYESVKRYNTYDDDYPIENLKVSLKLLSSKGIVSPTGEAVSMILSEKIVYSFISDRVSYRKGLGEVFQETQEFISKALSIDLKTLGVIIRKLENKGLIEVNKGVRYGFQCKIYSGVAPLVTW